MSLARVASMDELKPAALFPSSEYLEEGLPCDVRVPTQTEEFLHPVAAPLWGLLPEIRPTRRAKILALTSAALPQTRLQRVHPCCPLECVGDHQHLHQPNQG